MGWRSAGKVWPSLEFRVLLTRPACEVGACHLQPEAHSRLGRTTACAWLVECPKRRFDQRAQILKGAAPLLLPKSCHWLRGRPFLPSGRTGEGYSELSEGVRYPDMVRRVLEAEPPNRGPVHLFSSWHRVAQEWIPDGHPETNAGQVNAPPARTQLLRSDHGQRKARSDCAEHR